MAIALAKVEITDPTVSDPTVVVGPPSTTNHQPKRKRDKVIIINEVEDADEDENTINNASQQRKRSKKEERRKKEKKEKKQLKFKATHEPDEPIPRKKKRQRLDSHTLTSIIDDTTLAQDLQSGVKRRKKKEKTRDRDQLMGEVYQDRSERQHHEQKHATEKGPVIMALEGLESKKKRRKSKVE